MHLNNNDFGVFFDILALCYNIDPTAVGKHFSCGSQVAQGNTCGSDELVF